MAKVLSLLVDLTFALLTLAGLAYVYGVGLEPTAPLAILSCPSRLPPRSALVCSSRLSTSATVTSRSAYRRSFSFGFLPVQSSIRPH